MTALTRRSFLATAGAAALTSLTACGGSSGHDTAQDNAKVVLPSYVPYRGVSADLPGDKAGVLDTFLRYPKNPRAAADGKPGRGGRISGFVTAQGPLPPRLEKNRYWQALNQALGVQLDLQEVPSPDYGSKFATLIAGGKLPDFVQIIGAQPHLPRLLESEFQNLSDFLAGDKIKDYPFLANIPTDSWRTTVHNGGIYGLPIPRAPIGPIMMRRDDLFAAADADPAPKSYQDFVAVCKDLTDAKHNRWAAVSTFGMLIFIQEMLGVPNTWRRQGGTFVSNAEVPETKEAVARVAELVKAGVFHPDTFSATTDQKLLFGSGRIALHYDNYVAWGGYQRDYAKANPGFRLGGMLPPAYTGKGQSVVWQGGPSFSLTGLTKASPARIKELLSVANWLAAPFGTREYLLRKYGVEGVDFTRNGQGDPTLTGAGLTEAATFTVQYLADAPPVLYEPGSPDVARQEYRYEQQAIPELVKNPTLGLYSDTDATKSAALTKILDDAKKDIYQGRKPISSWDEAVRQWKQQGGDTIAAEYQKSYELAH